MKIDKHITTKVTLSKKEVTDLIKKHIKDTEGIEITYVSFLSDDNESFDGVDCGVSVVEKVK